MTNDHHTPEHPHWTDRCAIKIDGKWWVYRVDDPDEIVVEQIPLDRFCFHLFVSGAA
jgi:hypothetical protein